MQLDPPLAIVELCFDVVNILLYRNDLSNYRGRGDLSMDSMAGLNNRLADKQVIIEFILIS